MRYRVLLRRRLSPCQLRRESVRESVSERRLACQNLLLALLRATTEGGSNLSSINHQGSTSLVMRGATHGRQG